MHITGWLYRLHRANVCKALLPCLTLSRIQQTVFSSLSAFAQVVPMAWNAFLCSVCPSRMTSFTQPSLSKCSLSQTFAALCGYFRGILEHIFLILEKLWRISHVSCLIMKFWEQQHCLIYLDPPQNLRYLRHKCKMAGRYPQEMFHWGGGNSSFSGLTGCTL